MFGNVGPSLKDNRMRGVGSLSSKIREVDTPKHSNVQRTYPDEYEKDSVEAFDPKNNPIESISKISDVLFIGNDKGARDFHSLHRLGITHIVNTADELENYYESVFDYARMGMLDSSDEDISDKLEPSFKYISFALSKGGKVFVHCYAGMSRSATIVLYYLMKSHRVSYDKALQYLKRCRPIVQPNAGYERHLREIE